MPTRAPYAAARRDPATPPEPAPRVKRSKSYLVIGPPILPRGGGDRRLRPAGERPLPLTPSREGRGKEAANIHPLPLREGEGGGVGPAPASLGRCARSAK